MLDDSQQRQAVGLLKLERGGYMVGDLARRLGVPVRTLGAWAQMDDRVTVDTVTGRITVSDSDAVSPRPSDQEDEEYQEPFFDDDHPAVRRLR
jgi:hypothetical protein